MNNIIILNLGTTVRAIRVGVRNLVGGREAIFEAWLTAGIFEGAGQALAVDYGIGQ